MLPMIWFNIHYIFQGFYIFPSIYFFSALLPIFPHWQFLVQPFGVLAARVGGIFLRWVMCLPSISIAGPPTSISVCFVCLEMVTKCVISVMAGNFPVFLSALQQMQGACLMGVSRKCGVAKHANYGALRWMEGNERVSVKVNEGKIFNK